MMIYDVFGRHIGVQRDNERWRVYRVDLTEGKHSSLDGVVIPDFITEAEIPGWLDDIYHEAATASHPEVKRIR